MTTKPVIKVSKLSKYFGNIAAVDDIGFDVNAGEVVGFVGPNGAGKTTTIGLLMGFLHSSSGSVEILGKSIRPESAHTTHREIGYVAGDMALFDNLTAEQYLAFFANLYGGAPRQAELLDKLQPRMGEKLKRLSRGNKQKVALVGAFQHNPKLAILDEPTSGLDPLMQETFLDLIRTEHRRGATVFMSSHILSEVASVCSRVMFMKRGRIITDQPVAELENSSGKIITITADKSVIASMHNQLPEGAVMLDRDQNGLRFRFDGNIQSFVAWLGEQSIVDLTIQERDLDDIFHDLYRNNDEEAL